MTDEQRIEDLVARCVEALMLEQRVALIIPGPPPRGERVRFDRYTRKKCPMGEILCYQTEPPGTAASFCPKEILEWMAARCLIEANL